MLATASGFNIELTQAVAANIDAEQLKSLLAIESWIYRDAPDYGSDELSLQQDAIKSVTLSDDRKTIRIDLASLEQAKIHPQQTARVYHAQLKTKTLFTSNAPEKMDAYYTLYQFPKAKN
jgi:uncharacterized protein YheU (UPF0270 family)